MLKTKSRNEQFLWEVVNQSISKLDVENLGRMMADYHTSYRGSEFDQIAKLKSCLKHEDLADLHRGYFLRKGEIRDKEIKNVVNSERTVDWLKIMGISKKFVSK